MESLSVSLIKCGIFYFKNVSIFWMINGQLSVLAIDRAIIFILEVKTLRKKHSDVSWPSKYPWTRQQTVCFPMMCNNFQWLKEILSYHKAEIFQSFKSVCILVKKLYYSCWQKNVSLTPIKINGLVIINNF